MIPIEDRIGQMLVGGFNGLTAPDYLLDWLQKGRLGAVILFARNVESPEQLAALTKQLHTAAKYPLLIGIDQEGGTVARLRDGFTEIPAAMALASIAADAPAINQQVTAVLGAEMHALGINWVYAPVVDITYNPENPSLGTRSYGTDQDRITEMAAAAVRGYQSQGVAACAKHFPGLGNTPIDTHLALPRLDTSVDHLLKVDLQPYREIIAQGLATVMTTHTIFTALDPDHPATLSTHIVKDLLRGELGFEGVVATDCMEMKAIDDHYGVNDSVVRAANAGIDLIHFSHTAEKQSLAYDSLLNAVRRGDVPEVQIDVANRRIAALKARFPVENINPASIQNSDHLSLADAAARAGTTLIRSNDGVLPLRPDDGRRVLLVEFFSTKDSLVQEGKDSKLVDQIRPHLPQIDVISLPPDPDTSLIASTVAHPADVIILATRSAHLASAQVQAIQQLNATGKSVVLLALRNPYDAGLIDADTIICTSGDSRPSLRAAAAALTGVFIPSGRLPVEVT